MGNAMMSIGNRGKNRILKAKPLRFAGKMVGRGIGAVTLGTVGLAAGISTGDFSNVLKYGAAGAGVGGALGGNLSERGMDSASRIKEDFKEGFLGKEEYDNRKLDNEYFNGQGFQEMLDNSSLLPNLSGRERINTLREEIEGYRAYGLTDNKQISSCMNAGLSVEEGACALQIANKLKGMGLGNKEKAAYEAAYRQQLGGQFSNDDINKIWSVIEKNM